MSLSNNVDVIEVIDQLISDIRCTDLDHYLKELFECANAAKNSLELKDTGVYTESALDQIICVQEKLSYIKILENIKKKIELISDIKKYENL